MLLAGSLTVLISLYSIHSTGAKVQELDSPDRAVIQVKGQDIDGSAQLGARSTYNYHNFTIVGDEFMLDGQPLRIVSGSLHYFRVPAAYWRDRLHKLKAAGLNAVSTYVEWSYHEPEERQYNFEGDRDIVTFIKLAAEEGLHVLLRPGPYICAERDLGGLPYWLLGKYPNIRLRSTDKDFMDESKIWMEKLFEQVKPLLFGNGGPILLVQVENEYGSYGSDMLYKKAVRDILLQQVNTKALLYTTDGTYPSMIAGGAVEGALTTIDFGPSNEPVQNIFRALRMFMPSGPLMNSEYYPGWLTHWGEKMASVSTESIVKTLKNMLDNKVNVNFYMFFGGSNFEFTSGANYEGTYQPDITSYDYDAPLSEAGDPTPKYYAIRDALKKYNLVDNGEPAPEPSPKGSYGRVTVTAKLDILSSNGRSALGKKYSDITGSTLPTFESLRQRSGFVLYETILPTSEESSLLEIQKPRDLIFVFVNGALQGRISRMNKLYSLPIMTPKAGSTLSLLVENQGRINFRSNMHDPKGILSEVKYSNRILNGTWKVTGYPLENVDVKSASEQVTCPTIYEGHFTLPDGQAPLDTFLDTTGWAKGLIWINGHNLGRYWAPVGPQITLYVPGIWLKPAPELNHLQILELYKPYKDLTVEFIDHPILNRTGDMNAWL